MDYHIYCTESSFQDYISYNKKSVISEFFFGVKSLLYDGKLHILRIIACVHSTIFILSQIFTKMIQNLYFSKTGHQIEILLTVVLNTHNQLTKFYNPRRLCNGEHAGLECGRSWVRDTCRVRVRGTVGSGLETLVGSGLEPLSGQG